jgi:hypothetical protein
MKVDNELKSLDEVMDTMSEEHQLQALDNQFPYLFTKAEVFLKVGPEVYRKEDFFGQPKTTDSEELEMISKWMLSTMSWKRTVSRESIY